MAWQDREVRKLLRLVNRPTELEQCALALRLKLALDVASPRDAVLTVVKSAFEASVPVNRLLHLIVQRCDIEERKTAAVVTELSVSRRAFFRMRVQAIAVIANKIDRILSTAQDSIDGGFTARVARTVAPFEVGSAMALHDSMHNRLQGRSAYDALCCRLASGLPLDADLLSYCTGSWHLLARLQIAKWHSLAGNRRLSVREQRAVRMELHASPGHHNQRVAFDLADISRIAALERGDLDAARDNAQAMYSFAGTDPALIVLALLTEGEQLCEQLDFEHAQYHIDNAQNICAQREDAQLVCRAAYATALLSFLKQRFQDAFVFANASHKPLLIHDPRRAMIAAGLAGRAALMLGKQWTFPDELCDRYPLHHAASYLHAVNARHNALDNPSEALAAGARAVQHYKVCRARPFHAYALSANAVALLSAGRKREGYNQLVLAWQQTNRATLSSLVTDQFVHERLPQRAFGPFLVDQQFLGPVRERVMRLINAIDACENLPLGKLIASLIEPAIRTALRETSPRGRKVLSISKTIETLDGCTQHTKDRIMSILGAVAWNLASCLQPHLRNAFDAEFALALSSWLQLGWRSTMRQSA